MFTNFLLSETLVGALLGRLRKHFNRFSDAFFPSAFGTGLSPIIFKCKGKIKFLSGRVTRLHRHFLNFQTPYPDSVTGERRGLWGEPLQPQPTSGSATGSQVSCAQRDFAGDVGAPMHFTVVETRPNIYPALSLSPSVTIKKQRNHKYHQQTSVKGPMSSPRGSPSLWHALPMAPSCNTPSIETSFPFVQPKPISELSLFSDIFGQR